RREQWRTGGSAATASRVPGVDAAIGAARVDDTIGQRRRSLDRPLAVSGRASGGPHPLRGELPEAEVEGPQPAIRETFVGRAHVDPTFVVTGDGHRGGGNRVDPRGRKGPSGRLGGRRAGPPWLADDVGVPVATARGIP